MPTEELSKESNKIIATIDAQIEDLTEEDAKETLLQVIDYCKMILDAA